jgi:hypothetical protein
MGWEGGGGGNERPEGTCQPCVLFCMADYKVQLRDASAGVTPVVGSRLTSCTSQSARRSTVEAILDVAQLVHEVQLNAA